MSLNTLLSQPKQLLLFGGKGGVGKTTMAAATAMKLAEHFSDKKVLVFTTDPAPSLGDSFDQEFTHTPTPVNGVKNLWALEINAEKELEAFKKQYGDDILDILQKGTYLSDEESEEIFSLDIPGLDEVMGLKKITDFIESSDYDYYVLDTAPTGHTLRLLTLPELLNDWIAFLGRMRYKYHYMVDRFSRGEKSGHEPADTFLVEMKKTVNRVRDLLHDEKRSSFVVVTIAEAMGVLETKDLVRTLKEHKLPVEHLIVNNLLPEDPSPFLASRRAVQDKHLKDLETTFTSLSITKVNLLETEARGTDVLKRVAHQLFN
jgi:arsenite/tail-anchored protein-transporting ATPase